MLTDYACFMVSFGFVGITLMMVGLTTNYGSDVKQFFELRKKAKENKILLKDYRSKSTKKLRLLTIFATVFYLVMWVLCVYFLPLISLLMPFIGIAFGYCLGTWIGNEAADLERYIEHYEENKEE